MTINAPYAVRTTRLYQYSRSRSTPCRRTGCSTRRKCSHACVSRTTCLLLQFNRFMAAVWLMKHVTRTFCHIRRSLDMTHGAKQNLVNARILKASTRPTPTTNAISAIAKRMQVTKKRTFHVDHKCTNDTRAVTNNVSQRP